MVVSCSGPRRPPEKFRFEVVQRRQEKRRDARAKSLFCQSNPILLFCRSCCCRYMYVWIHGRSCFEKQRAPDFAVKEYL